MANEPDQSETSSRVRHQLASNYSSLYDRLLRFIQDNKGTKRAPFLLMLPYLLFMGVFFFVPVLYMFIISFYTNIPGGTMEPAFTLENYLTVFTSDRYVNTLYLTVRISVISTFLALVISYPISYFIVFSKRWYSSALILLAVTPLLVGTVVRAFGWFALLDRSGLVTQVLTVFGVDYTLLNTEAGLIIAIVSVLLPFAVLILLSNLYTLDPDLIQAGKSLGGSPIQTFFYVTLPLSMPGIIGATLIAFILTMGTFATAVFVGMPQVPMLAPFIYEAAAQQLNWPLGAALSFVLLFISLILIYLYSTVMERGTADLTRPVDWFFGDESQLGRETQFYLARYLGKIRLYRKIGPVRLHSLLFAAVLVAAFVYLLIPVIFAILISFSQGLYIFPPETPTLEWYESVATSSQWIRSFAISFQFSILATILALVFSFSAAYGLGRYEFRGKQAISSATFLPLIIPQVILGIALLIFLHFFGLVGSLTGLAIGLAVYVSPFCTQTLLITMNDFDRSYEEAALSLGADELRTFKRVTIPLLLPGLISASILAFILSFANLQIAVFLQGAGVIPVPVRIFASVQFGATPVIAAVATINIIITLAAIVIVERIFGATKALGYTA